MSEETLKRDLSRWAYEKLKKWELDTAERFKMAGLPSAETGTTILGTLFLETANGAVAIGMTDEQVHRGIEIALGTARIAAKSRSAFQKSQRSSRTSSGSKWRFPVDE